MRPWILLLLLPLILRAQAGMPPDPLEDALADLRQGQAAAALPKLEHAAREAPGDPRVWLALALCRQRLEQPDRAEAAAAKAAELAPGDPATLRGLAVYYAAARDFARAAELEARFARLVPSDPDALPRAASFYLDARQPDQAVALATEALARDDRPRVRALLAKALEQAGQPERALTEWRTALEGDKYQEPFWVEYVQLLLKQQDYDAAVAAIAEARRVFARSGRLELALGVAYYAQRRFPDAVTQFLRAATADPALPQPYLYLGRTLQHAGGRIAEITARFEGLVRSAPGEYLSHFLYGKALASQLPPSGYPDQARRAEQELRESIRLNDRYWEAHFQLGVLLERKRDFAAAEASLRRGAELNPEEPTPHYRLSRVLTRLGRRDEAAREQRLYEKFEQARRAALDKHGPAPELEANEVK